jgi:asparagine synthase (glutamine-hydrolysing)
LRRHLGPAGAAAAAAHPPETYVEELRGRFDERHPGGDYLAWMSYASLKTHLVEDYLARLDKLGMQESVEGRVPLLDPVLARWAFRVPQRVKVPGYRQKALFRSAVEELLPGYIVDRPKQGFNAPVGAWASALLAERLDGESPLVEEGIVTAETARELMRSGSTGESFALWALGTLTVWCRQNL